MVFLDNSTNKKISIDVRTAINHIVENKYDFHSIDFLECETLEETKHLLSLKEKIDINEPIIFIKDANLEKINYFHLYNQENYNDFLHLIVNIFGNSVEPIFIERIFSEYIYESLLEKCAPLVVLNITPTESNPNKYYYSMTFHNIDGDISNAIIIETLSIPVLDSVLPFKSLIKEIWHTKRN